MEVDEREIRIPRVATEAQRLRSLNTLIRLHGYGIPLQVSEKQEQPFACLDDNMVTRRIAWILGTQGLIGQVIDDTDNDPSGWCNHRFIPAEVVFEIGGPTTRQFAATGTTDQRKIDSVSLSRLHNVVIDIGCISRSKYEPTAVERQAQIFRRDLCSTKEYQRCLKK
jgi:hypothetical protein